MMSDEMVTITKKEYNKLKEDSDWLYWLTSAGVDNWEGCGEAYQLQDEYLAGQGL